jgi:hypothetical protein
MAKVPDIAVGFSGGIRYWLFFMIGFALLGYDGGLSIGLGAIGGLAGGAISAWLNQKEKDDLPDKSSAQTEMKDVIEPSELPVTRTRFQKYGLGSMRPRKRTRVTQAVRRFGWLFRTK